MFFRFYILINLFCLLLLSTALWFGAIIIISWLLFIAIISISRYKEWKNSQKKHHSKTLSFCIKSMRRQKQNFKVIEFLIRNQKLQNFFKKVSILMDDINVKVTQGNETFDLIKPKADTDEYIYTPTYRHYGANIYQDSK